MNFNAHVDVIRLVDEANKEHVVGYVADVKINCLECGLPFEFIGIRPGLSNREPRVSLDSTELRAPLQPSSDPVEAAKAIIR